MTLSTFTCCTYFYSLSSINFHNSGCGNSVVRGSTGHKLEGFLSRVMDTPKEFQNAVSMRPSSYKGESPQHLEGPQAEQCLSAEKAILCYIQLLILLL